MAKLEECCGVAAYGGQPVQYTATINLADLATTTVTMPLFALDAGTTIVAAKAVVTETPSATANIVLDIGDYKITADNEVGTVIDADAVFTATVKAASVKGTVFAPAATASGLALTENAVFCAKASTVTTAATEGKVYVTITAIK